MKKKKLAGKLSLNKVTISKLEASEVKGGRPIYTYIKLCDTNATLEQCPTHQVQCNMTNSPTTCVISKDIVCLP